MEYLCDKLKVLAKLLLVYS